MLSAALADRAAAQSFGYGPKGGVSLTTQKFEEKQTLLSPIGRDRLGRRRAGQAESVLVDPAPGRGALLATPHVVLRHRDGHLTYVEVPILLRYPVFGPPSWRVHVVGGAVVSHLLEAREKVGSGTSGAGDDITDKLQPNDTAMSIGADVQIKRRWVADFRYLYGLTEVYPNTGPLFAAKQRAMQFTVSYRFR
jgi:hypothetical protein